MMRFAAGVLAVMALAATSLPAQAAEVKVGDEAPDFTLKDQSGEELKLSSFREKKHVLLAFYPKDHSPGCTNQMKTIVREQSKLTSRDVVVIGVSGDSVAVHKKFATSLGIRFKLLADTDFAITKKYGVFSQTAGGGFAARSVFLIDKTGKVRFTNRDYRVPKTLDGTQVLAEIEKLGGASDPAAGLDALPEPERSGKKFLLAFVKALLEEDIRTIDRMHHKDFGTRTGETPAMQRERRKARIQEFRDLFKRQDMKALKLEDVLQMERMRVFTKETATPIKLGGVSGAAKKLVARMDDADLFVVGRTTGPRAGGEVLVDREVALVLRKQGKDWKLYEKAGKR